MGLGAVVFEEKSVGPAFGNESVFAVRPERASGVRRAFNDKRFEPGTVESACNGETGGTGAEDEGMDFQAHGLFFKTRNSWPHYRGRRPRRVA